MGQIVGQVYDADFNVQAALWSHEALTFLPGIAGGTLLGTPRPFLWQNGVTTPLPMLPAATTGSASGINDRRQIVGETGNVAVLWQNGTAIDLNSRIAPSDPLQPYVYLRKASRINNLGQIVASGSDSRSSDPDQWYVLTPVN